MEEIGLVEKIDGQIIVDLKKITRATNYLIPYGSSKRKHHFFYTQRAKKNSETDWGAWRPSFTPAEWDENKTKLEPYKMYHNGSLRDFLINAFHDKKVISRDDWDNRQQNGRRVREPAGKPLFYEPENDAAAFDLDKIKNSDFYIGAWQIKGRQGKNYSPFLRNLRLDEAAFACLIYHPNFGAGVRDAAGNLLVKDKQGKRDRISQKWLMETGYQKEAEDQLRSGGFLATPHIALKEDALPNLTENNLLKPDDFRISATVDTSKKFGLKRPLNQAAGMVMLSNRIRYTLGREFGNKKTAGGKTKYWACEISDTLGGVMEMQDSGEEKLIKIFDLLPAGDPRLKTVEQGQSTYFSASAHDINLRNYNEEKDKVFIFERSDENKEGFQQRAEAVDYAILLEAKQKFIKATGISVEGLSAREQNLFLSYYRESSQKQRARLYKFVKIFEREGLKAFLALHLDPTAAENIFAIAERYTKPEAALIFQKYGEIVKHADDIEGEIRAWFEAQKKIAPHTKLRASEYVMRSANKLLAEYAAEKRVGNIKTLFIKLDQINDDLLIFAAAFKALSAERTINFEDIKDIEWGPIDASEISAAEKEKMVEIFVANRPGYPPELLKKTKKEFVEALNSEGKKFYVLKDKDELISFMRFDELPNGNLYAGSLNVRTEAHGSNIGSAVLKAALEKEARHRIVEAVVFEKNPMLAHYIKDFGFKVVGEIANYEGTGQKYYKIERAAAKGSKQPAAHRDEWARAAA